MATITVGYQTNINKYFPAAAFKALDAGRKLAQKNWSKYANIVWAGSTYPRIYIYAINSTTVWGEVRNNKYICVTYNNKVWKNRWTDVSIWENLFMHEMGHILVSSNHCSNPIPGKGGNCVMSITGKRLLIPCASCTKKLQARYGKPR
jgi:hypothetical protein